MVSYEFVVRRLLQLIPQLIILTLITFFIIHLVPGGPGSATEEGGRALTEEQVKAIRAYFGIDRPLYEQYWSWVKRLVSFDFGNSYLSGQPVASIIGERVMPTLILTVAALFISILAIPLGILSAQHRNSILDHSLTFVALTGVAIPNFWFSILAILIFALWLGWLPAGGMRAAGESITLTSLLSHLILPAIVLGTSHMASLMRYVRSSITEVLNEDYIRTARAKGLAEESVLLIHALRNALLPVVTVLGLRFPYLIGGAVLVETVFGWPGMGRLAVDSALRRDYPVTMALVVIMGFLTIIGNLLADLCYGWLDPRIRQS